jgi:glycine/D-amino acid oxidase-like deaminating enzyme
MEVVIVGAGTFGGSLAWWLARSGDKVTLVDQYEPGDERASSGGETRFYRCAHGPDTEYTAMARRARTLWHELEEEAGEELLVECGCAWFAYREDGWEADSERTLVAEGIPAERLDITDAAQLYPTFGGEDLAFVLYEPEGGVLRAERSMKTLAAQAVSHGARILRGRARPEGAAVVLGDSTRLEGDVVIWACGPWLPKLFPDLVSLRVTQQELLFLDGGPAWRAPGIPVWVDYEQSRCGTADIDAGGVKAFTDDEGPALDPDADLPTTTRTEADVRAYLLGRFPALAEAPLLRTRSCRYEITADTRLIGARHPGHPSVWIVGGGSGHGLKLGPPMAERVATAIASDTTLPAGFALGPRAGSESLRTASSSGTR